MAVPPIPPGYRSVTPYLAVAGAAYALTFYQTAFGARERMRLGRPDGGIGHAELEIGDSIVMLADPWHDGNFVAPSGDAASVHIHLYVADADALFARAVAAGAVPTRPMETMFYGDRTGTLRDPFGHYWHLATHVEDVAPDEIERRMRAMSGGQTG